jgi:hypothetical protein
MPDCDRRQVIRVPAQPLVRMAAHYRRVFASGLTLIDPAGGAGGISLRARPRLSGDWSHPNAFSSAGVHAVNSEACPGAVGREAADESLDWVKDDENTFVPRRIPVSRFI